MKQIQKTSNAFRAPSHPEQLSTDNNPRKLYKVVVHSNDYRYIVIHVKAQSEQDAETLAEEIARGKKDSKWGVADRDLYAYEVEQVKEGGEGNE